MFFSFLLSPSVSLFTRPEERKRGSSNSGKRERVTEEKADRVCMDRERWNSWQRKAEGGKELGEKEKLNTEKDKKRGNTKGKKRTMTRDNDSYGSFARCLQNRDSEEDGRQNRTQNRTD